MNNINERIQKIKYEVQEKKRLNRLLNNSLVQKKHFETKVSELENQLKKEVSDVEKLKGLSFQNFLHIIVGDKDQRMEKEKKEMISAKLKYESALNELNSLERTIVSLKEKINNFGDLEEQYNDILKEKQELIYNNKSKNSEELFKIIEEQCQIKAQLKELKEALNAGVDVVNSIEQVEDSIKSAEDWGTFDMLGGGFISTMKKHSYMDEAQKEIEEVQDKLLTYNRELKDIGTSFNTNISLDSFTSFADYFFDGLFVDLSVQSHIKDAQNDVSEFKKKILSLNQNISQKINLLSKNFDILEKKRIELLESI